MNNPTYLLVDVSNLLYRTFYVHQNEDAETLTGLATHAALITLNKYYKQFKPTKIILAFDRSSWRKKYTSSTECISKKAYKGTRRQNFTEKDQAKYDIFLDHIAQFEQMIDNHTSLIALADEGLEADDLIGGTVQVLSTKEPNAKFIVVTTDQDMIQLLGYPNVRVINPTTGKDRTLADWDNDAEYFIFEKCIRGDKSDNVQSALPGVHKTVLKRAFADPYMYEELMQRTWMDQNHNEYKVLELFEENKKLMDLRCQPTEIQKRIIIAVLRGVQNPGSFSYFHFKKYLGQHNLKRLSEQVQNLVPLLSC